MNEEMPPTQKEGDAKYKIEFSQTNYKLGPNEDILKIIIKEDGEEKTFETRWPKGGVQLFDPQTKEKEDFVKSEDLKKMYEDLMDLGIGYEQLVEMRNTRSLIFFFKLKKAGGTMHL